MESICEGCGMVFEKHGKMKNCSRKCTYRVIGRKRRKMIGIKPNLAFPRNHLVMDDIKQIQNLYMKGCTLTMIQNHLYPDWRTKKPALSHYLKYHNISLLKPNVYFGGISVENVEKFWENLKYLKQGRMTTVELREICNMGRTGINNALKKFNIDIPEQVYGKHAKRIIPIEKYKNNLHESEKAVINYFSNKSGKLFRLEGYGCDFLYQENHLNILIESKTTLSDFVLSKSVLQLIYGRDIVEHQQKLKIDRMLLCYLKESKYENSEAQRYARHFGIELMKL